MNRGRLWGLITCLAAFGSVGCGDSLQLKSATGTVTYKGAPVDGATVTFMSDQGRIGAATTDSAGKYSISTEGKPGAIVGKHGVMISKAISTVQGEKPANPSPQDMIKMASKAGNKGMNKALLPQKYATTQGSGLSADVTTDAAKNVFDFDLKD